MTKRPKEQMTALEWGALRSFLARKGLTQAVISQAIGTARIVNGVARSRRQISSDFTAWLKDRPKKQWLGVFTPPL